ncbi:hypothetical protein [Massilia sp. BSC265]|uniref:hypothetical protein n=1 Tax=Massilia sp. BSC265 TaxID=1549812 RepID=UPI0004E93759|nr:hypothetical protein [Massilia sp. BSC265]KFI05342.1 hypothetical protein JN27_23135 [Massilia sp. BSC265]
MQQPPRRGPNAGTNFLIAALLGIPGLINLAGGITRGGTGEIICGLAALGYALLLVRDALSIRKTGRPAMPQSRMILIGFGFLSVYMVGLYLKHAG